MPRDQAPRPRKRFAQHFLTQPNIAQRIVELARLTPADTALEIGPGRAALTHLLAAAAGRLWVVEIDRDLADQLRTEFSGRSTVRVVEGDVLEMDLEALLGSVAPVTVVANLPYNISTPLLMQLLSAPRMFRRMVLMLQWEVAERICSPPGSKAYGALSVMMQLVADVRIAFRVPPGAFHPKPKVDSAVIVVEPRARPEVSPEELGAVRRVVRTAFNQRRKQLANALRPLHPQAERVLDAIGIDPRRRPETLSVGEFVEIARAFAEGA